MDAQLEKLLSPQFRLPGIPGVAQQVLALANQPDTSTTELARLLSKDPAMAGTVLRYVNSPSYSPSYSPADAASREVQCLERAAAVMGFDAVVSVALSFAIVDALKSQRGEGLDYPLFWRRSLLSAVAARTIGASVREPDLEPLFLAGLLQDIGMLALDYARMGIYKDLGEHQLMHELVCQHEVKEVGLDHARFGGWLLEQWGLPKRISQSVASSHRTPFSRAGEKARTFDACVAISGVVADFFVDSNRRAQNYQRLRDLLHRGLGLDAAATKHLLHNVRDDLTALSDVLDKLTVSRGESKNLKAMAREALAQKNVGNTAVHSPIVVREDNFGDLKKSRFLADIDDMYGVLSHQVFEAQLGKLIRNDPDCILNIALIKVTNLQAIEVRYGTKVATLLLRVVGRNLTNSLRDNDLITRYGDTFGVGLIGTSGDGAKRALERVMERFSGISYSTGDGHCVELELSAGVAVASPGPGIALDESMKVASKALTEARQAGDLQIVTHLPSAC